jgi:hypothetical protein
MQNTPTLCLALPAMRWGAHHYFAWPMPPCGGSYIYSCWQRPEVEFLVVCFGKISRFLPNAIHRCVFPPLLQNFKVQGLDPGFLRSRVQNNTSACSVGRWGLFPDFLTQLLAVVSKATARYSTARNTYTQYTVFKSNFFIYVQKV